MFDTMERAEWHVFQVLTKRSSLMRDYLLERYAERPAPGHVWLGVSVEEAAAKSRIEHFRQAPAGVRFLSIEPLIGAAGEMDLDDIHWMIAGGESGPGARPMHIDRAREVRNKCESQTVPSSSSSGALPAEIRGT